MSGNESKKRLFSGYVSKEIFELMNYLIEREEVTKVVFVRRAIRNFMDGPHYISPRLRITQRSDPDYVERKCMVVVHMEDEQREQLKKVAEEQHCTLSQVFFQVILDYCAVLISLDGTGMEINP